MAGSQHVFWQAHPRGGCSGSRIIGRKNDPNGLPDILTIRYSANRWIRSPAKLAAAARSSCPRGFAAAWVSRRGSFVVAEEREDGILIRPATVLPVEIYSPERRAEFLLNNAVGAEDYRHAQAEVKRMGLDPSRIKHHQPAKRHAG
jgi:hypothetical protein